ncbi:GNAT family N-acetyltransferase [Rapidithrix thailandica]|uniref:GNAT family N-acetyltransferase n=1 Tax=Rapidithrix thailandica TaxID=413964 RepID=A0AAW9RRY0_9BACT
MIHNVAIHKVEQSHLQELQQIGKRTFEEAFKEVNTAEDMETYLRESFHLEKLRSELNHPESQFFFVYMNAEVIGYLKLNLGSAQTDHKLQQALEVERIYVLQEYHGKKIGQMLLNKALEIARMGNVKWVWLGVWEHNVKAIRFYEKNGFQAFDTHPFILGTDRQTDVLMKRELA